MPVVQSLEADLKLVRSLWRAFDFFEHAGHVARDD
jgi:hypothetical protein